MDGLKTLNELKDKDVTEGEVIRKVFPDAIPTIPANILEQMDKTPMVWPHKNNASVENSNSASNKIIETRGLTHDSNLTISRPNLNWDSNSLKTGEAMPYMMLVSYLYKYQTSTYVDCGYNSATNTNYVDTSGSYTPTPGSGLYQNSGHHWGDYPEGSTPATYNLYTYSDPKGI